MSEQSKFVFTSPAPDVTVPMRSAESVLLAWEVVEVHSNRRVLEEAVATGLATTDGWDAAARLAMPVLAAIRTKPVVYRRSIENLMRQRQLAPTSDLDELVRVVKTLAHGDRLVCHVAMFKAYSGMANLIRMQMAHSSALDAQLEGICEGFRNYAFQLFEAQQADWTATAEHHRARGLSLDAIYPFPNPFGVVAGLPCWQLLPAMPRRRNVLQ